ncbi:poly-beta-hydroxybutyrate polymerase [Rhodovibrio salinarum]|uniref:Poly-beta-hydroxybutyrate polymerase n=2 Tax=Rhodovibrio salinarum TaxID=1087 RepID=A0A934QKG8_9PROT|nr:poly-beta-hydroxybutyrate polymerase [Rhodovibrio salinarum]
MSSDDSPWARTMVPLPPGTDVLDRVLRANLATWTGNISPPSLGLALADWLFHLTLSPGKHLELQVKALRKTTRLMTYAWQRVGDPDTPPCIQPLPGDRRFKEPEWQNAPYDLLYQGFLLTQQWWWNATNSVDGVAPAHERRVQFMARQMLDTVAPSNFPWTNPVVAEKTRDQGGANLIRGWENLIADIQRQQAGAAPEGTERYRPGQDVAVTPGTVVFRNRLIELIQYHPTRKRVHPEPVLIVPAWIMKYYILDLSPENSLIRYLVDQGHTVFCISWHNPTAADRELSLEDYRRLGIAAARQAVQAIVPNHDIHAVGYCIGGTLLSIEAARMARDREREFASLTLFAAQVDFTEPGELELFIDESEVSLLEDTMWAKGYLETREMAAAFQMLRSSDLIWSRMVRQYLLGERDRVNDLMAWNADATRMPYRMHAQYLRQLFLANELAHGRYCVNERPVALPDIRAPIFAVATETDHIAPWRSVYQLHLLSDTQITFVLTRGGHNAGIVSEPGHPGRYYRIHTTGSTDAYRDPEVWFGQAEVVDGSWWPAWHHWLAEHSGARRMPPPEIGNAAAGYPPHEPAPGSYVFER